jgi:hypothetical protein
MGASRARILGISLEQEAVCESGWGVLHYVTHYGQCYLGCLGRSYTIAARRSCAEGAAAPPETSEFKRIIRIKIFYKVVHWAFTSPVKLYAKTQNMPTSNSIFSLIK